MRARSLAILLLTLGATACGSLAVTSEHDKNVDFSALEHFSWSGLGSNIDPQATGASASADDEVRRTITENFEKRGYQFVRPEEADFLLSYQVVIEKRLDERVMNTGPGAGTAWGNQNIDEATYNKKANTTYIMEYTEGSLIIEARDAGTNNLLWQGVAESVMDQDRSAEKKAAMMRSAVEKIVKRFPARH
ncbi:MAG: DUF4136 domain-containing protein [Chromatiales bacterium]|nr:DUF4136 domain-containing protein [Chromatiales bacterium]